jgi:hypothetical protein
MRTTSRLPKKGNTVPIQPPPPSSIPSSLMPDSSVMPLESPHSPGLRPLPANAPEWMQHARVVSATIEAAIQRGQASPPVAAAMTRAIAGWHLAGHRPRHVVRISRLVERAIKSLKATPRHDRTVENDCATVVYNGLPSDMKRTVSRDDVLDVVREMRSELDPDRARTRAIVRLMRFDQLVEGWVTEALSMFADDDG